MALLRGVNVGGHRRVPMANLRTGLTDAGLTDVATYLQSGNAVFSGGPDEEQVVVALVRSVVQDACGVRRRGRRAERCLWHGQGSGRSRLQVDAPGAVATARNWRTVMALARLAAG